MHYAGEVPNDKTIVSLLVQYGALDAHVRPTSDLSDRGYCRTSALARSLVTSIEGPVNRLRC